MELEFARADQCAPGSLQNAHPFTLAGQLGSSGHLDGDRAPACLDGETKSLDVAKRLSRSLCGGRQRGEKMVMTATVR